MNRLKRLNIIAIAALTLLGATALPASAATDKEMDRARAVAAQVYLRYTNDKSDYLDGFKPQSVADIRAKVSGHSEDEANLQKFLAAPVSNDYPNWGKEELVRYWSSDFFSGSGLSDKAADTRNRRIQARLNTMDVTPPSAQPDPSEQSQQEQPSENMNPNMTEITAPTPVDVTAPAVDTTKVEETETITETDKGSSNLWIYIVLLIVLIGVVIALVVYALKSMRGQNAEPQPKKTDAYERDSYRPEPAPAPARQRGGYESDGDGRYARVIAAKDDEIDSLRRELEDSRAHSEQLAARLGALQLEVQRLTEENTAMKSQQMPPTVIPAPAPGAPRGYNLERETPIAPVTPAPAPMTHPRQPRYTDEPAQPRTAPRGNERVVFLGRVNRDNVFVRADKQLVSGKTIYRLVTTNGVTGSFYVEPDPVIMGWVSLDPETALAGGCSIVNPTRIDSFSRIVTDAAGTAIFEDGCWKVLRAATVRLE